MKGKVNKMKATFKSKYRNEKGLTVLVYEYRGYEYEVTEYGMNTLNTLKKQHTDEQARIDRYIANNESRKPVEYTETAEYALDLFFNELQ